MPQRLAVVALGLVVATCASIGPGTVPHDRIDYASVIGDSWKAQTLLNIVKLRYADMSVFLEVAQVIAGYQLQSALTGSFAAGNVTAGLVGPFTAAGTATAAGTYTDRPTVIYQPLTGADFLRRLMTPIPPSSVLFVLQSGYSADRIMPIMLDSINDLNNESNRLRRSADPKFTRLVELMREGQLAGAIQIRIERPKEGAENSVLIFGPSKDPQLAARGRELKSILGIKPDLRELRVNYGGYSGRDDEIDMMTRSIVPESKAGRREQPITRELAEMLQTEREMRDDRAGWIFPSLHKDSRTGHRARMDAAFRDAVVCAGLDPELVTPHVMRHTAITTLVQAGVDLPTIQKISGHKTLTMVLRYAHVHGQHIDGATEGIGRTVPELLANKDGRAITQELHSGSRNEPPVRLAKKAKGVRE